MRRLVRAPRPGDMAMGKGAVSRALVGLSGVEGGKVGALMAMRSVGTARAIDALPALPGAERELAALAAAIGADGSQLLIGADATEGRSEEHTSEFQSLMRISYAVFCLKKKINTITNIISI